MKIRLGKLLWKLTLGLVVVGGIYAVLLLCPDNSAQKAKQTRQTLRQQGFKTDLADFNFSTSAELRAREAILTATSLDRRSQSFRDYPNFMAMVGTDSALVVWKQDSLKNDSSELDWPTLLGTLKEKQDALDAASDATLSGHIRFNLDASGGNGILLPHLAMLKNLTQTFDRRAMLDLHDGNKDAAWTNLLASTRLVTVWEPEPAEVSHLVWFGDMSIVFAATWQLLQADGWPDDQLARLQSEWESVDFFTNLPETVAFKRASNVAECERERQELVGRGNLMSDCFNVISRHPTAVFAELKYYWGQAGYRKHGTYVDEKALLLYYRDRELELRNVIKVPTWAQMRQLSGVANTAPFRSQFRYSRLQQMSNMRETSMFFQKQGSSFLGRAAEAEARRRILVTAIALERYRGKHGLYPKILTALAPEFLKTVPADFMDGQPLRYRLTDDGHFILYSVGLDCIDNGGKLQTREQHIGINWEAGPFGIAPEADLVWPRPASAVEVAAWRGQEFKAQEGRTAQIEEREAADEKRAETLRQAAVKKLLAMKPVPKSKEPTYQGKPLSKVLRNENASGTNKHTLDKLLSIKQIITGQEPDIATFEIPISYDVVTKIGRLRLLVDAGGPEPTDSVWIASSPEVRAYAGGGEAQECSRATNGNCLLVWNTTYDPPGQHALQTQLHCTERQNGWHTFEIKGPVAPFYSSNICQFDPFYSEFDSSGAILHAKLPEPNGIYTIELNSPTGEHIRTIAGTTSNGVIHVKWDLKNDHGNKYTNDSINAVFHVTLPDSGRSQTMKGP